MAWGIVAGATIGLIGSSMQSGAASDAAGQQAASTDAATAEQRRQADRTYADYAPYRAAGTAALGTLQSEMDRGISSSDVTNGAGYQFGLQQGQQGLDRKAAAGGGRVSGAALKSAAEYATNYATTGYNAEYQRRQDRLNRLASLAGIGQSATGSSAAAGAGAANAISSLTSAQGNASGAATLAQGNIWGNSFNQLGAAAGKWASGNNGGVSNGSVASANMSSDPIGSLASSQAWYQ